MRVKTLGLFIALLVFGVGNRSTFVGSTFVAAESSTSRSSPFEKAHNRFFFLRDPDVADLTVTYDLIDNVKEKNGPGEFDRQSVGGSFSLGDPWGEDFALTFGGAFKWDDYNFSLPNDDAQKDLYSAIGSAGALFFISDQLLLEGSADLGAYTDFEDFEEEDLRVYGGGTLTYMMNPWTQLIGGVRADRTFDDSPVYPIIGLRVLSEEGNIYASITFPTEAKLVFRPLPDLSLYGFGRVSGEEWRTAFEEQRDDLRLYQQRVGGGISYWFSKRLSGLFEAGALLDSSLEFQSGRSTAFDNGDLKSSPFITAELGLRF